MTFRLRSMTTRREILLSATYYLGIPDEELYRKALLSCDSKMLDRQPYVGEDMELVLLRSFNWEEVGNGNKTENYNLWKNFAVRLVRLPAKIMTNEKGQPTQSADFRSVEDALQAKAAMVRVSQDQVDDYAKKNNIQLSPKARQFFSLINYNAGEGNAQKMLQDYFKAGALKDDAFLKARPVSRGNLKSNSWSVPYENVIRRIKMAEALRGEGYFDDYYNQQNMASQPNKVLLKVAK